MMENSGNFSCNKSFPAVPGSDVGPSIVDNIKQHGSCEHTGSREEVVQTTGL